MEPARVRVVSDDEKQEQQNLNPGPPVAQSPDVGQPHAQPNELQGAPPEPIETTADVGGPVLPEQAAPEDFAAASGAGLAGQMRARFEGMSATEEFSVPGWELEDGRPGLIVVARTFGDRKAYTQGVSNEVYIVKSTHKLLYVDDVGERHEIEGGWGPGLAQLIGVRADKAADLVNLVISKPDPSQPARRIPNVAGVASLANSILNWAGRVARDAEEELGE